ncbi:MAG: DUF5916 domain-containing protein [Candidatus Acidiferrum sp.]
MLSNLRKFAVLGVLLIWSCLYANAVRAQQTGGTVLAERAAPVAAGSPLQIPHVEQGPKFEDFLSMTPTSPTISKMLKIDKFFQRDPIDGAPVSQKTVVYMGYTDNNLYVVCLCFDAEPGKIRARRSRREQINDDDQFGFILDPFYDKQHGIFFFLNPLGIQQDGIWDETQQPDYSFDMLWNSLGKLTPQGYVVWFEIPFRSLRFSPKKDQTWGIFLERDVRRNNESSFYPHISSNAQGFMAQEAEMTGLANISPGRNLQFIPYGSLRGFRALDDRDPAHPFFTGKHVEGRAGLDAKIVIKNALVLDATINPDFAQVESDDPQITVNQRFEVFFPEKRPFFLENASFFNTPVNLLFTRRIADPEYGVRLTGKIGPWTIGAMFADDKSPGRAVPQDDPLSGAKAYFSVLRVSHDIGKESSIGFMYTDRELNTAPLTICTANPCTIRVNRVGAIDAKFKLSSKWIATAQALTSYTCKNDGTHNGGSSYEYYLERSARHLEYNAIYRDTAEGFQTETGFFRRPDIRRFSQFALYRFRREGNKLQSHGPGLFTYNNWDHSGTRLDWFANANYRFILERQTVFGAFANVGHERLRPRDFSALLSNRDYPHFHDGFFFDFGYFTPVFLAGEVDWGRETNFDPASGPPVLARSNSVQLIATIRPLKGLTFDNSYLFQRLRDDLTGGSIFNNHIIRSKWNYQFNRELSLRVIGQYSSVLANSSATSLPTRKNINADILFTYLLHPGTAFYLGYNSNLQNLNPALALDPNNNILTTRNGYINDGRQFFVKISYLFRY